MRVSGDEVYVAETLNSRVLIVSARSESGGAAVRVLGQLDFVSRSPVNAFGRVDGTIMNAPTSVDFDGASLYVVDRGNNRVMIFDGLPDKTAVPASRVIGQTTLSTT